MQQPTKESLLRAGCKRYEVAEYKSGMPKPKGLEEFDVEGSTREVAAGGRALTGHIALENGSYVVYLPPEDPEWGRKSQILTPKGPVGFAPSEDGAKYEFKQWLRRREAQE